MSLKKYIAAIFSICLFFSQSINAHPHQSEEDYHNDTIEFNHTKTASDKEATYADMPWSTFVLASIFIFDCLFCLPNDDTGEANMAHLYVFNSIPSIVGLIMFKHNLARKICLGFTGFSNLLIMSMIGPVMVTVATQQQEPRPGFLAKITAINLGIFTTFLVPYTIVKIALENG